MLATLSCSLLDLGKVTLQQPPANTSVSPHPKSFFPCNVKSETYCLKIQTSMYILTVGFYVFTYHTGCIQEQCFLLYVVLHVFCIIIIVEDADFLPLLCFQPMHEAAISLIS